MIPEWARSVMRGLPRLAGSFSNIAQRTPPFSPAAFNVVFLSGVISRARCAAILLRSGLPEPASRRTAAHA
jgi:hypothetical protein